VAALDRPRMEYPAEDEPVLPTAPPGHSLGRMKGRVRTVARAGAAAPESGAASTVMGGRACQFTSAGRSQADPVGPSRLRYPPMARDEPGLGWELPGLWEAQGVEVAPTEGFRRDRTARLMRALGIAGVG